ncbi:MAG TPA: hypothetical protein VL992_19775 [Tepidisphaeraceae bacterium]|nr:hypothetical protein [Tepidisphaeraceae bacterium]
MNKTQWVSFLWMYAVLIVAAAVLALIGRFWLASNPTVGWGVLGLAGLLIVVSLATLPLTMSLEAGRRTTSLHQDELLGKLSERLEQVCLLLNEVTENQLISDRTKSVAFREKDRETVRRAVQEEIGKQDWEAALRLVNDIEVVFGYRGEAERFRREINSRRQDVTQRQISQELPQVERYVAAEAWGQAIQEAHRVMAMFPDDPRVQNLPAEIETRRMACKKKLMDSWQDAVNKHDVDGSIEVLKHLDLYLTPSEAEGMLETARGVFKEKINLLRAQFAVAVQEKRWADALRLGDSITSEFPNSRMAQEVRDMMEMLRQRAAEEPALRV